MKDLLMIIMIVALASLTACEDVTEGNISVDIKYNTSGYTLVGGNEYLNVGDFYFSKSSKPLTFKITRIYGEGVADDEVENMFFSSVKVPHYLKEKVSRPFEMKGDDWLDVGQVDSVMHKVLTIHPNTGKFNIMKGNNIKTGVYHVDIEVENVSGSKLLEKAMTFTFVDYKIAAFDSRLGGKPVIERIADEPNQLVLQYYDNGRLMGADSVDVFTDNRAKGYGFRGEFVGDLPEGEVWNVKFPMQDNTTYFNVEKLDFTPYVRFGIGRSGKYVLKFGKL